MRNKLKHYGIKAVVLSVGIIVLLAAGGASTIAWLTSEAGPLTNRFARAEVPPTVVEEFDGETKEDVKVQNIGNIDGFMRVVLTAVWLDADGNVAAEQVNPSDWAFESEDGWFYHGGFYYFESAVPAGGTTTELIETLDFPLKEGLRFELQVIASSIQADPPRAVKEAWGMDVGEDGKLIQPTPVPEP